MKVKYRNSILGYAWSILEPLALTVTFYMSVHDPFGQSGPIQTAD